MIRFSLLLGCSLFLLVAGCSRGDPPAFSMPPPAVTVAAAASQDVPVYLDEIGSITALQYVSVTPRVTGAITKIHFTDGAILQKGEALFTIDPRPYQATLDQAIADQKRNHAAVDLAELEWDRMKTLIVSHAVSQDDYDKMKNAHDTAEAQLAGSDAAVESARLNLEYCHINSPIDGRAGQRLVDVGNVVQANQGSLLIIQTLDPIYADFTCPESDLLSIHRYASKGPPKVLVKLPGDTDATGGVGALTFIDTQVENQSGTVKLRATLPNADNHFWPGQFINIRLILDVEKNAVLVPISAEQYGQTGSYVYVVSDDSKAELRPVTLGQRQGDMIVVQKGVNAGEKVITTGQMLVIPGGAVRITGDGAPAGPPGAPPDAGAKS